MRMNDWTDCIDKPTRSLANLGKSRREKSWTRKQYEAALRLMRRNVDAELLCGIWPETAEIIKAADYSYQARDHYVNGWVNDRRWLRFCDKRGLLPF